MGQQIPALINKDFISQCLNNEYNEPQIEITKLNALPAVPPGNNYTGNVIRVVVEFIWLKNAEEKNVLSLIVKSDLPDGTMSELNKEFKETESIFYHKFLPATNDILKLTCVPQPFWSPYESIIILEDLKAKGFLEPDRLTQLDFDHCRLFMVTAATLHAVSVVVHKEHSELIKSIGGEKMFQAKSRREEFLKNLFKYGLKSMADGMEHIGKFKRPWKIIKNISAEKLWEMIQYALNHSKLMNTINHGDPWTSNMMFKYDDDGSVREVKLFDFQLLKYGSPVSDLTFFIWSSANHDVRRNRLEDLYHVYLDTFNNKLLELTDSDAITYEDFKEEVQRFSPMALAVDVFMYATGHCQAEMDLVSFLTNKNQESIVDVNPYEQFLDTNYYSVYLPNLIEQYEYNGIFEYLEKHS